MLLSRCSSERTSSALGVSCVPSPALLTGNAASRGFHVSAAPEFFFKKRFFKKFFRRRVHPTDMPQDPMKLTLFNQWMIPEDLQLPKPGDPLKRIGAGCVDVIISAVAGSLVGAAAHASGLADPALVTQLAQGMGLMAWVMRDALGDGGNRSLGKRLFGLELAHWDGTLPTPRLALTRNAYWLALPAMALHPLAAMGGGMLIVFDVASVLLTADARKVGDYATGLRVVDSRKGRELRLQDAEEAEEIRALREEIEAKAPGFLAASTNPDDAWYEEERDRTMSSAEIIRGAQGKALPGAGVAMGAGMTAGAAAARAGAATPAAGSSAASELPFDPSMLKGGFGSILSTVRSEDESTGAAAGASSTAAAINTAAGAKSDADGEAPERPKLSPMRSPNHGVKQRK